MKKFMKLSKIWMPALLCVLFLGIRIQAEAAPDTITGVRQVDLGSGHADSTNAVALKWDGISSPGFFSFYQVELCENRDFTGSSYMAFATDGLRPEILIGKLDAGKSYYARISAASPETATMASAPIEVVTAPIGKAENLKQDKVEPKRISFSWSSVAGANAYRIGCKKTDSPNSANPTYEVAGTTSHSMSAAIDSKYTITVYAARKSSSGYLAVNEAYTEMDLYTTPKKITKLKMVRSGDSSSRKAGSVTFSWDRSSIADCYDYEIYGNNKKRILKNTLTLPASQKYAQIKNEKLKNGQFMRIRVRAYITVNGQKYPGKWSSYLWFAKTPETAKASIAPSRYVEDGLVITWSKITGAKNYTIYISNKKSKSGYKKAGTTTKTTYNLKTFNGSPLTSGTYYYYIVANKKVGKKTYKSDASWYFIKSIRIEYSY